MGLFSYDIKSFDDLFVHTLRDIYYAENQILKALPDMVDKATGQDLKAAFEMHIEETEDQLERLKRVFHMHGVEVKGVDCPAIDGILKEGREISSEIADAEVLDAALLAAVQAVEHYEITRYGTLVAWAKHLGREDCAAILQQNLGEEEAMDRKLTRLAVGGVNIRAVI